MTPPDADLPENGIDSLFLKYCDGALSLEEVTWLAHLIKVDPAVKKEFLSLCIQAASLTEHHAVMRAAKMTVSQETAIPPPNGPTGFQGVRKTHQRGKLFAGACLFAGLAAIIFLVVNQSFDAPKQSNSNAPFATLTKSTGLVRLQNVAIDRRDGKIANVRSGDTVSTIGVDSSAELTFSDGTAVVLSNDTEAMFEGPEAGRITFRHGNLSAEIAPQPEKAPFRITTPEANVAIHGTQLRLTSGQGKTRVGVVEGKVRVTDPTDQRAVDMAAGDQVEALGGEVYRLPSLPVPDAVAFRFGPKTLNGWAFGRLLHAELLPGSTGAVRLIPRFRDDGQMRFASESENRWTSGMFTIHPDTWVSVRYRVEELGWFELVVVARSHDIRHRQGVVYGAPPDFLACEPRVWRTVHYRLADFRIIQQPGVPSPLVGFLLVLNSEAKDVGLTVDQIWVNRGERPTPFPD